ncbi:hypothetical protein [Streptomyces neyagawaensis]|nr:hypothetical protein [Streptomyces neyagawaensis]MDE1685976.1 hypothetical protein [Streptomyces neyagawaensis]
MTGRRTTPSGSAPTQLESSIAHLTHIGAARAEYDTRPGSSPA